MNNMTIRFDIDARNRLIERIEQYECLEPKPYFAPKDMIVKPISSSLAREYISLYHYTHLYPDSTRECFAGYYSNTLCGIITYGTGVSMNIFKSIKHDITSNNVRELTRLWSPNGMPKNTESKLISKSIKMLPKEVKIIVSYSDIGQNHIGTIYQASNFIYLGTTKGSKIIVDNNGQYFHPRNIGIYKLRHYEYANLSSSDIMRIYNWKIVNGHCKHKYVFIRTYNKERKEIMNNLKDKIKPYPK